MFQYVWIVMLIIAWILWTVGAIYDVYKEYKECGSIPDAIHESFVAVPWILIHVLVLFIYSLVVYLQIHGYGGE